MKSLPVLDPPTPSAGAASVASSWWRTSTDPWTDLGLTLPIFVGYHLGVVFMPGRNAADFVTDRLVALVHASLLGYAGLTLALAGAFVATLVILGKSKKLDRKRFALVILEGVVYAAVMKFAASYVVGSMRLGPGSYGFFSGLVMALGAGFYEEVAFRVVLFGLGLRLLRRWLAPKAVMSLGWALLTAGIFSAWHYVGVYGDSFQLSSFVFRWVCGIVLVTVYHYRGFAPAVWTHALYDIWVMAL